MSGQKHSSVLSGKEIPCLRNSIPSDPAQPPIWPCWPSLPAHNPCTRRAFNSVSGMLPSALITPQGSQGQDRGACGAPQLRGWPATQRSSVVSRKMSREGAASAQDGPEPVRSCPFTFASPVCLDSSCPLLLTAGLPHRNPDVSPLPLSLPSLLALHPSHQLAAAPPAGPISAARALHLACLFSPGFRFQAIWVQILTTNSWLKQAA